MDINVQKGRYRAYLRHAAVAGSALDRAQALRHRCFITDAGLPPRPDARDCDGFDAACIHLFVEDHVSGTLVATCRLLPMQPDGLHTAYAGQFYDLTPLSTLDAPLLEVGRFCIAPDHLDPDILRLAWAVIGGVVDGLGIKMMFGCSSFTGTDPTPYHASLGILAAQHLGPDTLRPVARGGAALALSGFAAGSAERMMDGIRSMPPLLRTYLAMGAWVGGEIVPDPYLNTLHVFTAVETQKVPLARANSLRMILGQGV